MPVEALGHLELLPVFEELDVNPTFNRHSC